jgi:hypothetical protein
VSQPLLADAHKSFENVAVARSRIFILLQFEFEYSDLNFYLNNLFFELVDLLLSKMQLLLVLFSLLLLFLLFNTQKKELSPIDNGFTLSSSMIWELHMPGELTSDMRFGGAWYFFRIFIPIVFRLYL